MTAFRRVLVTGAGGFIGSHLTEELVRRGFNVRALVEYNSFNSWGWLDSVPAEVKAAIEVVSGDVRDPHAMREAVSGCDLVLHLAALIAIPYSYVAPQSYIDTNITGTLNLLQAARDAGVARFVHTSTSEVYGTARFVPITEEHPLQGQSPYAASKIGADQMALSFQKSFGLPVSVIRPFNTYGPRQSARAVIPTIISQILGGKKSIRLGSLHPTRDFNFVRDVAAGFVAVAHADKAVGEVVNVGSNFEISVGDTVRVIAEVLGREVVIEQDDQRLRPALSEVERLWADNSKVAALAGWSPAYGGVEGFRRGIAETAAWFADPANLALYKTDVFNR
ncbi:MAG TPA: NAD-dependent 4,6-dehydratase LegB [Magnetospirillum sp.]|jgi:dTDP-glucose 4,6-dehydratase|nr:NAD-dependent 4,6-dehydratase LegB [Magnetospirillum sp.]